MKYLLILLLSIPVLCSAQSRDTTITKTLPFVEECPIVQDTSSTWSDDYSSYFNYSRIAMGNRMNESMKYNKLGDAQFKCGTLLIGIGAGLFISAAYSDPVIYIEGHSKYTRDYFNRAKTNRNFTCISATAFTMLGSYLLWRSSINFRRANWHITPTSISYKF